MGGKADNLLRLQRAGLPVPMFYVVPAAELQRLASNKISEKLGCEFMAWKEKHGIRSAAVRSSAEGEDGEERSFAGQFASVMDVKNKSEYVDALRQVNTGRPKEGYSLVRGSIHVHAVVQEYIEPDAAGVLFTVNPANGILEIVINAASGHGSAVVDGEDAEKIYIDRLTGDIRCDKKPILSPGAITQLHRMATEIEAAMGCAPQDIEWAIKGEEIFILQTRPITKIAHLKIWDNANIGESFPGIVLPLTFSIARRGYELVYQSQGVEAGLDWYTLQKNYRTFHAMVGLFSGRMYYNLANWYRFIGLFPGSNRNQKYLDEQLQTVGTAVYVPPKSYPLRVRLRFYINIARRVVLFERITRRYWKFLEGTYRQYEELPKKSDITLLLENYTFIEQCIVPHMGRSADNDFLMMTYHGLLKQKLETWLGKDKSNTLNFLGALHDVVSARQAVLLGEIAAAIRSSPEAMSLLAEKKYDELDAYIAEREAGKLAKEYRDKFLHRFAEDQKIESVNPVATTEGFYALIHAYTKREITDVDRHSTALRSEYRLQQDLLEQLSPLRRAAYRFLLGRLKHHLRIREHNRLLRGKAYAYLRELFLEIGEQLVRDSIVAEPSDVHYLDIEEILRLVNNTGYQDDIRHIITERRARYVEYRTITPQGRFITTAPGDEPPVSEKTTVRTTYSMLHGTISSPGDVEGRVMVLDSPIIPTEPFDILVVSHTDPGWTPLIALARGIIIEHGGILSHAAIVTRELGIPSIIGVTDATAKLKTGMRVKINTAGQCVEITDDKE